jgi:serine/threonine-protein kinase RsbW
MSRDARETVELRIPSQLRYLGLVDALVQSFAAEFAWEPDDLNNLSTAAIEAASNAMEHGNQFGPDRSVLLRVRGDRNGIEIEIEDQGAGFDPRPYERELTAEDLLKLRGRGIFIMRSFMDEVSFAKLPHNGMKVRLVKRSTPVAETSGGTPASP